MMMLLTIATFLISSACVSSFAHSIVNKRATPGTSIAIGSPTKRYHEHLPLTHLNYANNSTDYIPSIKEDKLQYGIPSFQEISQSDAPLYELKDGATTVIENKQSYGTDESGIPLTTAEFPQHVDDTRERDRGPLSQIGIVSSSFFGVYGVLFLVLLKHIMTAMSSSVYSNFGRNALALFSAAFAWDNLVLGGGSVAFRSISKSPNGTKFKILEALSYPRFILHAILTPFLLKTSAELGKIGGVPLFNRGIIQVGAMVMASTIAILSTINVIKGGIKLDDSPRNCIKGEMTFFIHGEKSILHVLPSLLVTFVNLFIGISVRGAGKTSMGNWMIIGSSAILSLFVPLFGSGVTKITGNFSEVVLIASYIQAAAMAPFY